MPYFSYQCPKCLKADKKLLAKKTEVPPSLECGCEDKPVWVFGEPQTMVKEVLDNGIMTRRVERLSNIEELTAARSKDYKPKDPEIV